MKTIKRPIAFLQATMVLALIFSVSICWAGPTLVVVPDKTVLSPVLIKKPIMMTGSGWKPGELVVVNLIPPKGVKIKGATEGEPVGIANGNADDKGMLKTKVGPLAVLMTFFQTGWIDDKAKPDFSKATPLPPREYKLEAIGLESGLKVKATLTLLPPPKKKK